MGTTLVGSPDTVSKGHRAPDPPERRRHWRPALPRPRVGAAPRDPQELRALRPLRHAALQGSIDTVRAPTTGRAPTARASSAPTSRPCAAPSSMRAARCPRVSRRARRAPATCRSRNDTSPSRESTEPASAVSLPRRWHERTRYRHRAVCPGLAACATTLPPSVRVADISALAGTYSGRIKEVSQLSRSPDWSCSPTATSS